MCLIITRWRQKSRGPAGIEVPTPHSDFSVTTPVGEVDFLHLSGKDGILGFADGSGDGSADFSMVFGWNRTVIV